MDARELLGKATFFSEVLDGPELDALARVARRADYGRGEILLREGEPGDSVLVIASGTVGVTVPGEAVATLGPGAVVGEMSLLTGAPRSATVSALMPVAAYRIGKEDLRPILDRSPSLYERFAGMAEKRQVELERVHGPGIGRLYPAPRTSLASAIRAFFG